MAGQSTVVLVHGAWHGAWSWDEVVGHSYGGIVITEAAAGAELTRATVATVAQPSRRLKNAASRPIIVW